jgi:hypothetical protein
MLDIQAVFALVFFLCLWLPFAIIGAGFLCYPHKAIDNAIKLVEKFPGYNPNDYPNIRGKSMVFRYRLVGILFIVVSGLPVIVVLWLIWNS